MICPCCERDLDVADTIVTAVGRRRVSTIWRCRVCAEGEQEDCTCEAEGYYTEDERTGTVEPGDARRHL